MQFGRQLISDLPDARVYHTRIRLGGGISLAPEGKADLGMEEKVRLCLPAGSQAMKGPIAL